MQDERLLLLRTHPYFRIAAGRDDGWLRALSVDNTAPSVPFSVSSTLEERDAATGVENVGTLGIDAHNAQEHTGVHEAIESFDALRDFAHDRALSIGVVSQHREP